MNSMLRRLPVIFYGLAALFFCWSLAIAFWELRLTHPYAPSNDPMVTFGKFKALYQASIEAVYIVANGAVIQVLLKIFERDKAE